MAVTSTLLSLALALACADASARSCVEPAVPRTARVGHSVPLYWAALAPFPNDFLRRRTRRPSSRGSGGLPRRLPGQVLPQGNSITIESITHLTEMYQWDAPSSTAEAPPLVSWDDFLDFCSTRWRGLSSTTSPMMLGIMITSGCCASRVMLSRRDERTRGNVLLIGAWMEGLGAERRGKV